MYFQKYSALEHIILKTSKVREAKPKKKTLTFPSQVFVGIGLFLHPSSLVKAGWQYKKLCFLLKQPYRGCSKREADSVLESKAPFCVLQEMVSRWRWLNSCVGCDITKTTNSKIFCVHCHSALVFSTKANDHLYN